MFFAVTITYLGKSFSNPFVLFGAANEYANTGRPIYATGTRKNTDDVRYIPAAVVTLRNGEDFTRGPENSRGLDRRAAVGVGVGARGQTAIYVCRVVRRFSLTGKRSSPLPLSSHRGFLVYDRAHGPRYYLLSGACRRRRCVGVRPRDVITAIKTVLRATS